MIALLLALSALAAPIGFDRVDILSEGSATWLNDELPRFGTSGRFVTVRFIEQIEPVIYLPPDGLTLGISMRAIRVHWERPVFGTDTVYLGGGVQTQLLLPNGGQVGVAFRPGKVRFGVSVNALSSASWSRKDWSVWHLMPALGVGFGRDLRQRALWM